MNSSRHEPRPSTSPETVGPRAGATEIARVTLPITLPRSCSCTTVINVVISSGIITAVPDACTIRPTSSTSKAGATADRAVPARNTVIAVAYACLVVTRWRNQPVTGITAAIVSMNAVDTHCAACSLIWSDSISRGIALIINVSLRITTNVASTNSRTTVGVRPCFAVLGFCATAVIKAPRRFLVTVAAQSSPPTWLGHR
ncbi:hypothetical protein GCM10029964_069940 [Kibdelosporangium lantanae]